MVGPFEVVSSYDRAAFEVPLIECGVWAEQQAGCGGWHQEEQALRLRILLLFVAGGER